MTAQQIEQPELNFGDGFLEDHAGHIIRDPQVALIELIANAYDAGATRVDIRWPTESGGRFVISDNGVGLTEDEFAGIWKTLSYNRTAHHGKFAENPNKIGGAQRVAFGRSGKGRHGAFCFADSYEIEMKKGGEQFRVLVARAQGKSPFSFRLLDEGKTTEHGAAIETTVTRNFVGEEILREVIGSKFSVIPSFQILLNGVQIQLLELKTLTTAVLEVEGVGKVPVHRLDSNVGDRTTHLRGICWWVKQRAVGNPSWEGLDGEGAYLDGRSSLAKRFSFIVEADVLDSHRKADWTGFHGSAEFHRVRDAVHHHIIETLNTVQASSRKERKRAALEQSRAALKEMGSISRRNVAVFAEQIQERCPTMHERDLFRAVDVFAKMEQAQSGYDLLKRLQDCSPENIDTWNDLMSRWTAKSAELVLRELEDRLKLIKKMQALVESPKADELHDLQPLFERGLWIFGPEFEGVQFHSNRGLATIIRKSLGGTEQDLPNRRLDFVAFPDRSIAAYAAPTYDPTGGEINGLRKILVVELKKGGFELSQKEVDQARNYSKELLKAGDVSTSTEIIAYVLGASQQADVDVESHGKQIRIEPMLYRTVLARAQSRTFYLQREIEKLGLELPEDAEVNEVLSAEEQAEMDIPLYE
jgi:hypothetical protein